MAEVRRGDPKSLPWIFANAELTEPAISPLGPYPVGLSDSLMRLWLAPEIYERLRGAGNVGRGMDKILTAIEEAMRSADPQTFRDKKCAMWNSVPEDAITAEDEVLLKKLLKDFM